MREPYSLVVAAKRIKSPEKVRELLGRARFRADTYARLLAEWPALVAEFEREAKQVEARLLELTGAA